MAVPSLPGRKLTRRAPWQTTNWLVKYDPSNQSILNIVGRLAGKPANTVTPADIQTPVRDRLGRLGMEISQNYEGQE